MTSERENLKQIVESLIFASDYPITVEKISKIVNLKNVDNIQKIINDLNKEYRETGRSFEILKVAGGYRFFALKKYYPYLKELFKSRRKPKLSRAALETLSIIAYKQPVSRPVVESIRGVNIDGVLHTLLSRRLITIFGRGKGPGRPLLYSTTTEFLQYFGLNDISDLPNLKEIDEILDKREIIINDETE
ncbi:MAG: SMC-Scp complex subunit ScpB [Candidatus Helarchaeota archaeon]|nr:SMC-Scp complex subunit ScpB [Candidatus Helarchaeota archaeon]